MKNIENIQMLTKDDHSLLLSHLKGWWHNKSVDRKNAEELHEDLKRATVVDITDLPKDVIRLNSKIKIKADGKDEIMELILVTPDKANIQEKKISVTAPIGTALIGFRQRQKVKWRAPAGKKTFTILEVINN